MKLNERTKGYALGLTLGVIAMLAILLFTISEAPEVIVEESPIVAGNPWVDQQFWINHVKRTQHTQIYCAEGIPYHVFHTQDQVLPIPAPTTNHQRVDRILQMIWNACEVLAAKRAEEVEDG